MPEHHSPHDHKHLYPLVTEAIRRSLFIGPMVHERTERDWQALVFERLNCSEELARAGLSTFCELRAHWGNGAESQYNARVDIALIDDCKKVPVLVLEIKAVTNGKKRGTIAREDLAKLRALDFAVFEGGSVEPATMAVAFLRNSADSAVVCRFENGNEIEETVEKSGPAVQDSSQSNRVPDGREPVERLPTVAARLLQAPSRVLFRDRRYRTTTYQSNEANWQIQAGLQSIAGCDGWNARYEVGLNPGRADLLISSATDPSSNTIVEFKVHGERPRRGLNGTIAPETVAAYVQAIQEQDGNKSYVSPRNSNGTPILTGLGQWDAKICACRAEYRRCGQLIANHFAARAVLLFEDYAMIHDDMYQWLGLPAATAERNHNCAHLRESYPSFAAVLDRLSNHYRNRADFFVRGVSEGLESRGIEIHYFATLRLPWPSSGETLLLHAHRA